MNAEIMKPSIILNVDDIEAGRYVTTKILRKAGFEVWEAETGADALAKSGDGPDLVLLDINLPDINGTEVCKRIKNNPLTSHLPVLHLSATSMKPPDFSAGLRDGADGFLMQPVDPNELIATIKALLRLKEVERRLRDSEVKFRTALQSIGEAVISVDTRGVVGIFNPAASRLMGKTQVEAVGRSIDKVFHLADAKTGENAERLVVRAIIKGESQNLGDKMLLRKADGTECPVSVSGAPLLDDQNRITGAVLVIRDISKEETLKHALEESAQHFLNLANSGQALIWTSGLDGLCNYFNDIWFRFTGRTYEQEIGNGWVEGVHPDDLEGCLATYTESFANRVQFAMVYRLRDATGEYRWVLDEGSPRFDSEGQFLGYIGHCLDITDRKNAEDGVKQLNAELEKRVKLRTEQLELANKELEAFAYSVSHDLRAPLRAINGFNEILISHNADKFDEESLHHIEKIIAASKRMGQLIDDILELSRVSRQGLKIERMDISGIALSVLNGLREREPNRRIETSVEPGMEGDCDENLMYIVFENLLGNAWKFTGKKEVAKIEVGVEMVSGKHTFFVRDNGAGFDMAYADKLFTPFQRLHGVTEFPGTGIGLATVKRIIAKHDGSIWAKAESEKGATFYFTLG